MSSKKTQEEKKTSKLFASKRFIITELVISLAFLIPAQVLSFSGSMNFIFGILFFLLSVVIVRVGQLYMLKKDMRATFFGIIGLILLIIGIIFLIFSGSLNVNIVFAMILGIVGVIIGLRIWIIILLALSGEWT